MPNDAERVYAPADPYIQDLQVYVVGGAVRDALLGLPAGDRDWVVVGATPEILVERGFLPVGGDFPVFLHPHTREEFALARTERKTSRGYQGFTFYTGPDVTLEDDLRRRDLTVNAIAQDAAGNRHDPLSGIADLRARVLRHVGEAFAEDPVRILRLSRFAARFDTFCVAPDTLALCRVMVENGEVDALVAERVWKELSRGLMTACPSRMFDVLRDCAALARMAPELTDDNQLGARLDGAARASLPLPARYALLTACSPARDALSRRWRVPTACADHARLLPGLVQALQVTWRSLAVAMPSPGAETVVDILDKLDAKRQPERCLVLLRAADVMLGGRLDLPTWQAWADAVQTLDGGAIARACGGDVARIKPALRAARIAAVRAATACGDDHAC